MKKKTSNETWFRKSDIQYIDKLRKLKRFYSLCGLVDVNIVLNLSMQMFRIQIFGYFSESNYMMLTALLGGINE